MLLEEKDNPILWESRVFSLADLLARHNKMLQKDPT
jgi:hypothetical protein